MVFLFTAFFLVQNELGNSYMTVVIYEVILSVSFLESQLHAIYEWVLKTMLSFYWTKSNFSNISI